jgi:hypothetical protein
MNDSTSILLSTAYLPPIEYFVWIRKTKSIIMEREEHYIKQTFRNRCEIYSANGKHSLTIPVIKTNGNHTKIKDIKIDHTEKWQLKHWRAIESTYNQSPFFLFYRDVFEAFYLNRFTFLFDYNSQLLDVILRILKIEPKINYTQLFEKQAPMGMIDLRHEITPKKKSMLYFTPYNQVFNDRSGFISNLSIIDLIFNLGSDAQSILVNGKK